MTGLVSTLERVNVYHGEWRRIRGDLPTGLTPDGTFASPLALDAWLTAEGITPAEWDQIQENLGYSPVEATAAIKDGSLTAGVIRTQYALL